MLAELAPDDLLALSSTCKELQSVGLMDSFWDFHVESLQSSNPSLSLGASPAERPFELFLRMRHALDEGGRR